MPILFVQNGLILIPVRCAFRVIRMFQASNKKRSAALFGPFPDGLLSY